MKDLSILLLLLHTATLLCYAFQIDNSRQSLGTSRSRVVAEDRRSFVQNIIFTSALISSSPNNNVALAADEETNLPKISHKVYFDVRISRSDGSFYVSREISSLFLIHPP